MKLYTEEQVKRAIALTLDSPIHSNLVLDHLTPIELPSDEEISVIAMGLYGFKATSIKNVLEYKAFKRGAKWVINKIKGGQDE